MNVIPMRWRKGWAIKIHVTSDYVNQLDVMIMGKPVYGRFPWWVCKRVRCLHWSAGLWRGYVFNGEVMRRFVLKIRGEIPN